MDDFDINMLEDRDCSEDCSNCPYALITLVKDNDEWHADYDCGMDR